MQDTHIFGVVNGRLVNNVAMPFRFMHMLMKRGIANNFKNTFQQLIHGYYWVQSVAEHLTSSITVIIARRNTIPKDTKLLLKYSTSTFNVGKDLRPRSLGGGRLVRTVRKV